MTLEGRVTTTSPGSPRIAERLSIVIVSWNTRDLLERCLATIAGGLGQPEARLPAIPVAVPVGEVPAADWPEVFVVDNASTDGSAQMVRERFPQVRLIANTENVGFARGNNQALRRVDQKYVLLLNPDTEVASGALATLIAFLDAHPEVGAVGPRLLNSDGTLQVSCYPEPTLSRELWRLLHLDSLRPYGLYDTSRWRLDAPRRVDDLQGAAILLRRSVLDQVGLLDEDYFIYSEEIDLCRRLRQRGWQVWWVPDAIVRHHGGQSTRQTAHPMFLRLYEGKVIYFRKHRGPMAARLYKAILVAAAIPRLIFQPLARLESGSRRDAHLATARSYRRLLSALPEM